MENVFYCLNNALAGHVAKHNDLHVENFPDLDVGTVRELAD